MQPLDLICFCSGSRGKRQSVNQPKGTVEGDSSILTKMPQNLAAFG
jgi:hypothetical protein